MIEYGYLIQMVGRAGRLKRCEVEADMSYRAYTNVVNPHAFKRPTLAEEMEAMKKEKPDWVDKRASIKYPKMVEAPVKEGWPDIGESGKKPLQSVFETFHDAYSKEYSPGGVLCRIVDPGSYDNGVF